MKYCQERKVAFANKAGRTSIRCTRWFATNARPGGTSHCSPPIYRWDQEHPLSFLSRRDIPYYPTVSTVGEYRLSLRDKKGGETPLLLQA